MPAKVKGPTDHVVVVGAGLAGLSAALRLAGAGRKVTVVERESVPGGRNGLQGLTQTFDCIICNPPYVCEASMQELPAEFKAEPLLALAGGTDGMDFIRQLFHDLPDRMNHKAILILEIGNEREHFEAAFPRLEAVWLDTTAGEDQVLLVTKEALLKIDTKS